MKADVGAVRTIAVDLDGVLAAYSGAWWSEEIGDPLPGAKELLQEVKGLGYSTLLFTSRRGPRVAEWVKQHGFSDLIDEINQTKPLFVNLLDDRVVRFRGPEDPRLLIQRLLERAWWDEAEKSQDCSA